jgi:hypothetical protein
VEEIGWPSTRRDGWFWSQFCRTGGTSNLSRNDLRANSTSRRQICRASSDFNPPASRSEMRWSNPPLARTHFFLPGTSGSTFDAVGLGFPFDGSNGVRASISREWRGVFELASQLSSKNF